MSRELVSGYQKPDTDVITAAMALSYFQNQLGYEAEVVALGEPNDETKFALRTFGMEAPRVIETATNKVGKVIPVGHNEPRQSVSDIDKVIVTHLADHHRIVGFETAQPLWATVRPYGRVSTIITESFQEKHINIPANLAGMTFSAIISDALLLKSPTTTDHDHEAVKYLAKIVGIEDYEKYGVEMLRVSTNLGAKFDADIVDDDAKTFELGGKRVRIGQVSTVDLGDVFARQVDPESQMQSMMDDNNHDLFLLITTNTLNSNLGLLVIGDPAKETEATFGKKLNENKRMNLPSVVSRKK